MVATCRSTLLLSCCLGGLGISKAESLLPTLPASSLLDLVPSLARGRYQEVPDLPLCYSHRSDEKCVGNWSPYLSQVISLPQSPITPLSQLSPMEMQHSGS